MDYNTLTVSELRKLAAERGLGTGVARAGASKAQLVQAITTGSWPTFTLEQDAQHPDLPLPPVTPTPRTPTPQAPQADQLALLQQLLATLTPKANFNPDDVRRIVREEMIPLEVTVKIGDRPEVTLDRQHYKFPLLLAALQCGCPVMLVGPAGTGKTTAAHNAAMAMRLGFEAVSVGPMTSKADLFGYQDANGTYHDTGLVRTARDGGVFLLDEIDAGNAGVLTSVNMLLANGEFATPRGMLARHADFHFVAGANTYGQGANRQYVGRNQLDAATLDRFVVIDWPVDEGLEASFAGIPQKSPAFNLGHGGTMLPEAWLEYIRKARAAADKLGVRHVISPRAVQYGVYLFAAGVGRSHVEEMVLWKGLAADSRAKMTAEMGR